MGFANAFLAGLVSLFAFFALAALWLWILVLEVFGPLATGSLVYLFYPTIFPMCFCQ
jgi:hypothetical protein